MSTESVSVTAVPSAVSFNSSISRPCWVVTASAPSHSPHAAPETKVPPGVARVGAPELHTAATAPGTRTGSVIGTLSS